MSREHGVSNHGKLVNQLLFQANMEENIKVSHFGPLLELSGGFPS